jgi:putative ABC transport system permease protein
MLDNVRRDLVQAWRGLRREPRFSLGVVLTLALSIGVTTATFTTLDAAFLTPLPYTHADRLASLWQTSPESDRIGVSMLDFRDWEARCRAFEHLALIGATTVNAKANGDPERLDVAYVTGGFLSTFGIAPALGRTFSGAEWSGHGAGVLISDRLWHRFFGANTEVLNRFVEIEGRRHPVAGVLPAGFQFPERTDLWLPLPPSDGTGRSAHNYQAVGRLRAGVSLGQARADLGAVAATLAREYPADDGGLATSVQPLRDDLLGSTGRVLWLLLGAVSLVLLIACANVANLLLARALSRSGEVAVRLALGSSHLALVRIFATEGLVLALSGGALSVVLVGGVSRFLAEAATTSLLTPDRLGLDLTSLLFTAFVAVGVGLFCGWFAAEQARRASLGAAMATNSRTVASGRQGMRAMVTVEVALAFVLLVGAGLLLESSWRLSRVDPGFRPGRVAVARLAMGGQAGTRYNDPEWRAGFFTALLARIAAEPGLEAVGAVSDLPLSHATLLGTVEVDGVSGRAPVAPIKAVYRLAGGSYAAAMGIPLLSGDALASDLPAHGPQVALINERLARELGGIHAALGRRIAMPDMDGVTEKATIVGVLGNVHQGGLESPTLPEVVFPFRQRPLRTWAMSFVARGAEPPAAISERLREDVRRLDPSLPVELRSLSEMLAESQKQSRFRAQLLTAFAIAALLLAAIGVFAVVSHGVRSRRREVGIRVAIGADRRAVRQLLIGEGMRPVVAGLAAGCGGAAILTRGLGSLVFEVAPGNVMTFAAVAILLGGTSLLAVYLPARRAARVDPIEVLRAD